MTNYGYANGWVTIPEKVKDCIHVKIEERIDRCLTKITCKECGFSYKIDSGD
jgi:hypothetical protein